ncbi:aldehyde dehydrogenase family protein [Ihubacter massiliensis]|uniref:3-sulfolactaldehyde dehydrogenase n=1 Tax=Hominibacterium faecale TaxID=2839743 RepID=A0A9J6QSQ3_9FIRM|nr:MULTISPECIES: aldehyde dehydrogenase family protein [Eubacteriales Family XIII. Incertae Sedis]MCI7300918.1 aldehyde dehydrogenase family protein [Clostridia bacterium]MCO7123243.1 aldehyde dehydrogenase family protein [Ihubacter massiliensis]MCU7377503.1 aldehyde dehydrogenase family protein [Hominibacterium faecale]MDY3010007.1 aldehyde dehydrogenase family protein [Clostridiales Family XIII bacterium]
MKMIINGKKVDSVSGETFDVLAPATGEVIESVPKATAEDIEKAIDAAEAGQKIWAEVPVCEKAEVLYRFLDIVEENKESLAQLLSAENGKPITEARAEIGNIKIGFSGFIEHAKHYYGAIIPPGTEAGQAANLQLVTREPIGIVACIIPFNFPCDLYDQKVAPALMMGNAAIVLPSSDNPLTLMRLTEMLVEAGVPNGVIQCITAPGAVKSAAVADPRVHLVTLTGSTEVGIDTAQIAAKNLTHTALELGGNDAFIVLEDGDVDLAVEEMIWGRMYNTGQVCCASKRFLVHNSLKDEFAEKCVARIKQMKVGMPKEENTQIGCLISEKAAVKVEKEVELTVQQGGKVILGGKRNGAFYEPTVIVDVPKTADVAKDMEIFGPVVPIIGFDTDEEAIEIANASIFGLSSCVFSKDQKRAFKVAKAMEAGGAVINGASFFRAFEMPFGGWKHSGIGTEGVMSTFDEMTRVKNIVLKNIYE